MKRLFAAAAIALAAFASPALANGCDTYGPPCDTGGSILLEAFHVDWLKARGAEARVEGYCSSACTMILAVPGVCVERDAAMGFHSATWRGFGRDSFLNGILLRHYSRFPELREWFEAGPMLGRSIWVLPARQLARRGVPLCEG